ncbi:MAG: PHP domain-containing protein [Anaerolineales bacterium]|nr:PHP domain-containing protein [Anaerolineales bacterium]
MLTIETHCHTHASPDSRVRPADLVSAARRRGLDRVIITDHWSIDGALEARELDPELVIVGEEVMTDKGELLAAYVSEHIPKGTPYREAIARLREQGAFISVSHPCDPRRSYWSPEELDELGGLVDAFETFNARNLRPAYNQAAAALAARHGLPGTAGSDAHTLVELGRATMRLPHFEDGESLRRTVNQAKLQGRPSGAWVRLASRWAAWFGG